MNPLNTLVRLFKWSLEWTRLVSVVFQTECVSLIVECAVKTKLASDGAKVFVQNIAVLVQIWPYKFYFMTCYLDSYAQIMSCTVALSRVHFYCECWTEPIRLQMMRWNSSLVFFLLLFFLQHLQCYRHNYCQIHFYLNIWSSFMWSLWREKNVLMQILVLGPDIEC